MSDIRCIIIEDEPLAAKLLTQYIKELPFLELKSVFKTAIAASDYLQENEIDLIFLDLHLPGLKGMAFLKTLVNPPLVIVTTAYHQYAVEGFELNVTDYLIKPIEFERFVAAVNKAKAKRYSASQATQGKEYIFVMQQKKNVRIAFADILYIESQREYVKIVTVGSPVVTRLSTNEIQEMLPANKFCRIHRSFIISLDKVTWYTSEAVEVGGREIPIGRDYRNVVEKFIRR